jgi:hypothetical protein
MESWVEVYVDGRVVHHSELNGPAVFHYGLRVREREMPLDEIKKLGLLKQVKAAMAEMHGGLVGAIRCPWCGE